MTKYLITAWLEDEVARELWPAIKEHGQSMIAAEKYAADLKEAFSDYRYTVRLVSDEQVREVCV